MINEKEKDPSTYICVMIFYLGCSFWMPYWFISFILFEFNPFEWHMTGRIAMSVVNCFSIGVIFMSNDDLKEKYTK